MILFERFDNLPRTQLLQYQDKRKDRAKIPLIFHFSKGFPYIINYILKKDEKKLTRNNDLPNTVIGKTIVGYKIK